MTRLLAFVVTAVAVVAGLALPAGADELPCDPVCVDDGTGGPPEAPILVENEHVTLFVVRSVGGPVGTLQVRPGAGLFEEIKVTYDEGPPTVEFLPAVQK